MLRVRELREAKGILQKDLADKAGIARSQLSEIERGKEGVNLRRLEAIAEALGVDIRDLFIPKNEQRDFILREFVRLVQVISAEDRETLLRLAASLAEQRQRKQTKPEAS